MVICVYLASIPFGPFQECTSATKSPSAAYFWIQWPSLVARFLWFAADVSQLKGIQSVIQTPVS